MTGKSEIASVITMDPPCRSSLIQITFAYANETTDPSCTVEMSRHRIRLDRRMKVLELKNSSVTRTRDGNSQSAAHATTMIPRPKGTSSTATGVRAAIGPTTIATPIETNSETLISRPKRHDLG